MKPGELKKSLGRVLDLTNALSAELLIVAQIEKEIGDQKARFDAVFAETEAKRAELSALVGEISGESATLAGLRAEQATLKGEIKQLDADCLSRHNTLEQIRKRLEAA